MKSTDYQTLNQASAYDQNRFSDGLKIVHNDEKQILENVLKITSQKARFLDLGTGTGRVVKILLKYKPLKIDALDRSRAMLDQLEKNNKKEILRGKINTVQSTSDKIPLPTKSIDLITALHLFKHSPNPNRTFQEISRVLKPGGLFIFDVLNDRSIVRLNLGTCYTTTDSKLKNQLKKHNLQIKNIIYLHYFGETIYKLAGKDIGQIIHLFDQLFKSINLKFATKIFVIAQKNE